MRLPVLFALLVLSAAPMIRGAAPALPPLPVEFAFDLREPGPRPFARDLWVEVRLPDGRLQAQPAFFDGGSLWRVRLAAWQSGGYRLIRVEERLADGTLQPVTAELSGPGTFEHRGPLAERPIRVDPADPRGFVDGAGAPYLPFGLNLAWGDAGFYAGALARAEAAGVNWTRMWMAPWSGGALHWRARDAGPSPSPGELDLEAARRWDEVLERAARHGVRVQLVVFSHGQVSSEVNPEWSWHPWNAAAGGFLAAPEDFFTSPEARLHTRTLLRYLTARYGHSPAILAWELFNEVNFSDAWRLRGMEAEVARWHREMAAWLRRCDPHGRLVTTSVSEAAVGPLWDAMDFLQPHLYAVNGLAHVRRFPLLSLPPEKPLFYGEIGDDHQVFASPGDKAAGGGLVPVLWSGLMTDHALPAQAWYWDRLMDPARWGEFVAVASFVRATRLAERRRGLRAFEPAVETAARVPHVIPAGFHWAIRPPADVRVTEEGREPATLADVPEFLVAAPGLLAQNRTDRVTLRLERAAPGTLRVHLLDAGPDGATASLSRDGGPAVVRTWPALPRTPERPLRADVLELPLPAGASTVTLRNLGPDSVRVRHFDLDAPVPALAAAARGDDRFVMVYVWHRTQVHAALPGEAAAGEVVIPDLPPGEWTATWWRMDGGGAETVRSWAHPGGIYRLATPPVSRHAAAYLERR